MLFDSKVIVRTQSRPIALSGPLKVKVNGWIEKLKLYFQCFIQGLFVRRCWFCVFSHGAGDRRSTSWKPAITRVERTCRWTDRISWSIRLTWNFRYAEARSVTHKHTWKRTETGKRVAAHTKTAPNSIFYYTTRTVLLQ